MRNDDALTAEDVAEMLQVSRSSVYKLVKSDELASYYVGRKLRFTMADVENYIARSRQANRGGGVSGTSFAAGSASALGSTAIGASSPAGWSAGPTSSTPPGVRGTLTLAGNDILGDMVSNYLGATGLAIERICEGSYNALVDVYRGAAQAALIHLFDGPTRTYNVEGVRRLIPGTPVRVIRLVRRRQGLVVGKGNPKGLRTWDDVLKPGIRLINRERGCGSRVLLDEQLAQRGVGVGGRARIEGYGREAKSGLAMASFVARGAADVGIGVERVFRQVEGVDFIPLQDEWLDIVLLKTPETERVVEEVSQLVRTRPFREEAATVIGYDVSRMGEVVYEA